MVSLAAPGALKSKQGMGQCAFPLNPAEDRWGAEPTLKLPSVVHSLTFCHRLRDL